MERENFESKPKDVWKTAAVLIGILIVLMIAGLGILFILGGRSGKALTEAKIEKMELTAEAPSEKEMKQAAEIKISADGSIAKDEKKEENKEEKNNDAPDKPHRYEIISGLCTWTQAEAACRSAGGYLATITSEEEYARVLEAVYASDRKVLWLGAKRGAANNFEWINGEGFSYASWLSGEPNNENGNENYLVMFSVNGQWVWADVPEDVSMYYTDSQVGYVCEYDE